MKKIAQFSKISKEEFISQWENYHYDDAESVYDNIILPKRASKTSASYDFFAPDDFGLISGNSIIIPTGIRCKIEEGYALKIYPKNGYRRIQIDNDTIISSDYYFSENEGHILIKMTNDTAIKSTVHLSAGDIFAQGIFLEYYLTVDDEFEG